MLARTNLSLPQPQCYTSLSLRAGPLPLHHSRALVVPKASHSSRSSSPRSEAWRSSWRTELEHGSNGNGNGAHSGDSDGWASAGWGSQATAADDLPQPEVQEYGSSNGWHQNGAFASGDSYQTRAEEEQEDGGEEAEAGGVGFFSDAFKGALKDALQRSPLYAAEYGGAGSGDEESIEPQPYESEVERHDKPIFNDAFRQALKDSLARQQAQFDAYDAHGSDDEYTPQAYVPAPPPRREMSPIEEVIATALGASQLHLRRLALIKNEIDAAIERESKQVERLQFALTKTESDMAYYKSLERMMQERKEGQ